jgi:hypothetical protein
VQATDALVARLPTAPAAPYLAPAPEPAEVQPEDVAPEAQLDSVAGWYAFIVVSLLLAVAAIVAVIAGAV